MNVISASRRTDIPAWYGSWLQKRLEAGSASYRNPFGGRVHTVSLKPADVIAFVFWTRNALPFLPVLENLLERGYRAAFQYTVTGYGPPLEGNAPAEAEALEGLERISDIVGPDAVRWRYDPIAVSGALNRGFHLNNFDRLLRRIEGKTTVCHTSFVQFYRKTRRRLALLASTAGQTFRDPDDEEKISLARELKEMAAARGVELVSCCYPLLERAGVSAGSCVDPGLIGRLRPDLAGLKLKPGPSRDGCRCAASRDIGAYNTCLHACAYCYATDGVESARAAHARHDPEGETL